MIEVLARNPAAGCSARSHRGTPSDSVRATNSTNASCRSPPGPDSTRFWKITPAGGSNFSMTTANCNRASARRRWSRPSCARNRSNAARTHSRAQRAGGGVVAVWLFLTNQFAGHKVKIIKRDGLQIRCLIFVASQSHECKIPKFAICCSGCSSSVIYPIGNFFGRSSDQAFGWLIFSAFVSLVSVAFFLRGSYRFREATKTDAVIRWAFRFSCGCVILGLLQTPLWYFLVRLSPHQRLTDKQRALPFVVYLFRFLVRQCLGRFIRSISSSTKSAAERIL